MSHVLEDVDRVGREADLLQLDLVGHPLIMEARRIHRLLNVQSVIHYAHQHIGNGSNDGGPAFCAEHQEELAVFQHDGGRHGRQRPLAGTDGIRRPLDQSKHVGHAWLRGEIVHFIVKQEAQAFGGDMRAEAIVQRGRDRHGIAFGIDNRIVRGVVRLEQRFRLRMRPGITVEL